MVNYVCNGQWHTLGTSKKTATVAKNRTVSTSSPLPCSALAVAKPQQHWQQHQHPRADERGFKTASQSGCRCVQPLHYQDTTV